MTDEIRVDYDLMDEMKRTFEQGREQLQDTMSEMQSLANALEDGALLGRGGEAFTEAIRTKLCPAISRLTDKFEELAGDIEAATQFARAADRNAASQF